MAASTEVVSPRRVVVATHSAHKLRELRELLAVPDLELVSLDDLGIAGEPVEDGATFEANARIKARFAARTSGLPALADDSGIEVEALGGRPGIHTRRFAGPTATDAENNAKLLAALAGLPPERRGARYVCVLVVAVPDSRVQGGLRLKRRRGTCDGRIATRPRGSGGFGYDPIFEPAAEPPGGRTFGQYSAAEKHAISHRAQAARRMRPVLVGLP
ncbi:MAG TPA: non-canonical purine NTP pyrophosphatase [Candidatus Binatus sp.]|nr:non-canonical purine NTP pyrophosphatase [Candidatus Binatus sp.]